MDTERYKQVLTQKKQDLEAEIARAEADAVSAPAAEVGDEIDLVTATQQRTTILDQSNLAYATLTQVDEALARIESGEFGKCLACGREIQPARLEAVPWAAYCIEDQERREKQEGVPGGSTL